MKRLTTTLLGFLLVCFIAGCGGGGGDTDGVNTRPVAGISISPTIGKLSEPFTFDASGSTDGQDSVAALQVRWDFDSDGTFDTAYSVAKVVNHTFVGVGRYVVTVEVMDTGGLTGQASIDIGVTSDEGGTVLMQDDFNDGSATDGDPAMWEPDSAGWAVLNNVYRYSGGDAGWSTTRAGSTGWTDYILEFDVMSEGGTNKGALFRVLDRDTYYVVNMRHGSYDDIVLLKEINGSTVWLDNTAISNPNNVWYHIRVKADGGDLRCWIDERLLVTATDSAISNGRISLFGYGPDATGPISYDNVIVKALAP